MSLCGTCGSCSRLGNSIRDCPIGMCSFLLLSFSLPHPCLTFWPPSCPLSFGPCPLSSGSLPPPLLIVVLPSILTPFSDSTQTPPFALRFIAPPLVLGLWNTVGNISRLARAWTAFLEFCPFSIINLSNQQTLNLFWTFSSQCYHLIWSAFALLFQLFQWPAPQSAP